MKKTNHVLFAMIVLVTVVALSGSCLAVEESEVQSAIASSSKEEVSGNVFIWFLCAIGFLKVSQKIDSFMNSLGINVGRTGGSMLGELMIAGRAVAGALGSSTHKAGNVTNNSQSSSHTAAAGQTTVSNQFGTGAIAMTQQAAANAGAAAATGRAGGLKSVIGTKMFNSSLEKSGQYSRDIIHSVATGSVNQMGMITGDRAAQALSNYMGEGTQAAGGSGVASISENAVAQTSLNHYEVVEGASVGGAQMHVDGGAPVSPSDGSTVSNVSGDMVTINGGKAVEPGSVNAPDNASAALRSESAGQGSIPSAPVYSNVKIGGGRITGTETPTAGGEGRQFAMYHADQYMEPTGKYDVVKTVDGETWFKQYAQPTVEKTPIEETDKGVRYDEKIVMQMPPVPRRMDKV